MNEHHFLTFENYVFSIVVGCREPPELVQGYPENSGPVLSLTRC
jgi:hypothetical protein